MKVSYWIEERWKRGKRWYRHGLEYKDHESAKRELDDMERIWKGLQISKEGRVVKETITTEVIYGDVQG